MHRYGFFLFALDEVIPDAEPLAGIDAVIERVRGHVLARGRLTGWQEG